jgi:hypothetical protein
MKFLISLSLSLISLSSFANSQDSCNLLNTGYEKINKTFESKGYSIVQNKDEANLVLNPKLDLENTVKEKISDQGLRKNVFEVEINIVSSRSNFSRAMFYGSSTQASSIFSKSSPKEKALISVIKEKVPNCDKFEFDKQPLAKFYSCKDDDQVSSNLSFDKSLTRAVRFSVDVMSEYDRVNEDNNFPELNKFSIKRYPKVFILVPKELTHEIVVKYSASTSDPLFTKEFNCTLTKENL